MSVVPSWIGSYAINRAMRFDNNAGWPTLDIFKGNDTTIYFNAKTSGPNVVLDEYGFELANVDLTNAKIMFLMADAENKDAVVLTKTNGDGTGGITVTDAVNGKMAIDILRTDFDSIAPGFYSCEVVFQDVNGKVHTLAKSVISVLHSISQGVIW